MAFVEALYQERLADAESERGAPSNPYGPTAAGWENSSIEDFLEAAIAWARDSSFGTSTGSNPPNPWRVFAQFLLAGKAYE